MSDKIERIDIKSITDPSFVKTLNYPSLSLLCHDIRKAILEATSVYGGHLSSNLGVVEATVALHRVFDFSKDKLIFDVGHQCYVHKILTGRSLEHLNEENYVAGFQKLCESPYDHYEAGHSSTSISAAEGFAIARDLKHEDYEIVAFIGDSSIVNGLSFEGLNDLAARKHKVIIVLNDNDMSISLPSGGMGRFFRKISTGKAYNRIKRGYRRLLSHGKIGKALYSFSSGLKESIKRKLVPITLFDNLGYTYMGPYDGHNIKTMERALKRAKNSTRPVVLHIITKKGKGYAPAERDRIGYWHGVTPFNIEDGSPKKLHPGFISWSHYFSDVIKEEMGRNENAYVVVPATGKGSGLEEVFEAYPDRCADVGIAEEHALTMSGALALSGLHPIVSIYSTFLQRAYDELAHDCARLNVDMSILIDRAGLVGKNGDTHQGIYDAAFLKSIPGIRLTMPSNKSIARALFDQSMGKNGVFCIRYSRELVPEIGDDDPIELPLDKFLPLKENGSENVVLTIGPLGRDLAKLIEENGIDCDIIDPVYLLPVAEEEVSKLAAKYKKIFVYDPYSTEQGFAQEVLCALMKMGYQGKAKAVAIPNRFIAQASLNDQLSKFGLKPSQALESLKEFLS